MIDLLGPAAVALLQEVVGVDPFLLVLHLGDLNREAVVLLQEEAHLLLADGQPRRVGIVLRFGLVDDDLLRVRRRAARPPAGAAPEPTVEAVLARLRALRLGAARVDLRLVFLRLGLGLRVPLEACRQVVRDAARLVADVDQPLRLLRLEDLLVAGLLERRQLQLLLLGEAGPGRACSSSSEIPSRSTDIFFCAASVRSVQSAIDASSRTMSPWQFLALKPVSSTDLR